MVNKSFHRALDKQFRLGDHRLASRKGVEIPADVRQLGLGKVGVMVIDLSLTGFRMRCMTRLSFEKHIFMTLPSFAAQESKICWHNGDLYGCQFATTLYPAVFDHIVTRYPSLKEGSF
ncbi:PilZ domain-containing protein [Parasphingorhabdus sp.]|uniref:PilZ domain-containing protein n=1 Tax=Parasphingorhabdus sp. TaxID=2709688 RepID=UPI002F92BE2E